MEIRFGHEQNTPWIKNEMAVVAYVCEEAEKLGLAWEKDEIGNILVKKPAVSGLENSPTICMQGHLDMVCEKNTDTQHDFTKDPLQLIVDGDFLRADGTTLGADNGIGVAAALAILADKKIKHGPLEALFTLDEEEGMTGALNLRSNWLQAKYLLNLDSEEEGEFCIGCAGGRNSTVKSNYPVVGPSIGKKPFRIKISGLKGGHSGVNIKDGLGNAIKLLSRFLFNYLRMMEMEISVIRGGNKVNAICREAWADVYMPAEKFADLEGIVTAYKRDLLNEYAMVEPNLDVSVVELEGTSGTVMSSHDDWRLISYLYAAPHGVKAMSAVMPGLVQTSTNLAFVDCRDGIILIKMSQRSSVASQLDALCANIVAFTALAGYEIIQSDGYPGWQPKPESTLNKTCLNVYKKLFRKSGIMQAIHAGLECGVIGEKYPSMEMISFGPNILDPHSPQESLEISTVPRFYKLLAKIIEEMSKS